MGAVFHKTRIAPTPSGYLHLGNLYAFAVTAALAQKYGARILLRIDDMDRERAEPEYVEDVFETLRFMQIPWQEGPEDARDFEAHFSQRLRLLSYEKVLERLVATGLVYACDCSRKKIETEYGGFEGGRCISKKLPLEPGLHAWRINTDGCKSLRVKSLDGVADVAFPNDMQHFVIRKKDGFPAYQVCSLADDLAAGCELIVRGQDLWSSTLAQLFLADVLGETAFLQTTFFHHALLTDGQDRKLSKSSGDTSIRFLRLQGHTAAKVYEIIGQQAGFSASGWQDFDPTLR